MNHKDGFETGDDPELDELRLEIEKVWDAKESRNGAPYDGIRGSLPNWVPEPVQEEFKRIRTRVLDNWKYSQKDAVSWIERFLSDDEWNYPALYPCGRELDLDYFSDTFGRLAQLRWAVSLGPERGAKELGGSLAQRGFRNRENLPPRTIDILSQLLDRLFIELSMDLKKQPSNRQIISALENEADNGSVIIQEVDWESEVIYWRKPTGEMPPLKFKQIDERMTRVRQRHDKNLSNL